MPCETEHTKVNEAFTGRIIQPCRKESSVELLLEFETTVLNPNNKWLWGGFPKRKPKAGAKGKKNVLPLLT